MSNALIICPEPLVPKMNALSGCWGLGLNDALYFTGVNYVSPNGEFYSVRNLAYLGSLLSELEDPVAFRPDFDVDEEIDVTAANEAIALLEFVTVNYDADGAASLSIPIDQNRIYVLFSIDPTFAFSLIGLKEISPEGAHL